jgi:arylsulfatase A-like enzyme
MRNPSEFPSFLGARIFFYNHFKSAHASALGRPAPSGLDVVINHVDIAPTSLGLCGLPVPAWMEGCDYSYLRRGDPEPPDVPDCALLQAIVAREESPAYRGIVTRDGWKYCRTAQGPWLMFNLKDDPYEMDNLAHVPRAGRRLKELEERLRAKLAETGDSFEF